MIVYDMLERMVLLRDGLIAGEMWELGVLCLVGAMGVTVC